jgi:hypothetical protein
MGQLIQLIISIVVFAVVAYGLYWTCDKFAVPQPVRWICGVILVIIILLFLANQLGLSSGTNLFPTRKGLLYMTKLAAG